MVAVLSELKVRFWLPALTLTVSWVPSWILPMIVEPGSRVSTSLLPVNRMAVPPEPQMRPALVSVIGPCEATAMLPPMAPEFTTLPPRFVATPYPPADAPPVTLPEFVTLT